LLKPFLFTESDAFCKGASEPYPSILFDLTPHRSESVPLFVCCISTRKERRWGYGI